MKILFTIILSSFYLISYSQENQTEKITLTNGSTLSINLQKIENGYVEYFEVGQSELKIIKTIDIKEIKFNLNSTTQILQQQNQPKENELTNWEDIKLVYTNNEVSNLVMVSETSSEKGRYYGAKNKLKIEAEEALKKKTLALGGKVVLVINEQFVRLPINTYKIEGIIYK